MKLVVEKGSSFFLKHDLQSTQQTSDSCLDFHKTRVYSKLRQHVQDSHWHHTQKDRHSWLYHSRVNQSTSQFAEWITVQTNTSKRQTFLLFRENSNKSKV